MSQEWQGPLRPGEKPNTPYVPPAENPANVQEPEKPEEKREVVENVEQKEKIMKSSLDFEGYRKNIANNLKEKRKESKDEAQDFLNDEKQTEKYKVSKNLKKYEHLLPEKYSVETIESENYDIQIFDINGIIPDDIKVFIDKRRLEVLTKIEREWIEENNKVIKKAKDFINEITEGSLYNPAKLNTVIYGAAIGYDERNPYLKSSENFNILDRLKRGYNSGIWFAAGDSRWFSPKKPIVITPDAFSKRFFEKIEDLEIAGNSPFENGQNEKYFNPEFLTKELPDALKKGLSQSKSDSVGGLKVSFIEETKWMDIAEWVVDLPNGKLYKIKEKGGKFVAEREERKQEREGENKE